MSSPVALEAAAAVDIESQKIQEEKKDEKQIQPDQLNEEEGPDGGFGWAVVVACFAIQTMALGFSYSFGVFLEHYTETWKDRAGIKSLTFIGTLATSLLSLAAGAGGMFAERVGFPIATAAGGIVFSLGLLLASFSKELWQLFITQGIMIGLGGATMFITTASAPSQWFTKRRGLATGICLTGSGIGGLAISPITQLLINRLGAEYTLRIFSAVAITITGVASPFVRTRVPFKTEKRVIDLKIFRNPRFRALLFSEFISCFGYLVPLFLMPAYAISYGMTKEQGAWLIGIINGGSALGSIVFGYAADYLGPLNILSLSMLARGLLCSCVWPFAITFGPLIAFSILYGTTTGAFLSLTPVVVSRLFGLEEMASINGLIYLGSGIPELVGTPLGTFILEASSPPGETYYLPVILYAGITALVASVIMLYIKLLVNRRFLIVV